MKIYKSCTRYAYTRSWKLIKVSFNIFFQHAAYQAVTNNTGIAPIRMNASKLYHPYILKIHLVFNEQRVRKKVYFNGNYVLFFSSEISATNHIKLYRIFPFNNALLTNKYPSIRSCLMILLFIYWKTMYRYA